MNESEVMREFRDSKAILDGHFILSSGLHSRQYMQCARLLVDADRARRISEALANKIEKEFDGDVDIVVAPAMGGVVIGALVALALGKPSIFCERENGEFRFRRGFDVPLGARALVVEDVVTTGLSSHETFACIVDAGGVPVAEACIANRMGEDRIENVPLFSLCRPKIDVFSPQHVPADLLSVPPVKPGSRTLKK
ncbi:MAG: orotate phosphoribosyltransferase [Rickettsiales bacterium]